MQFKLALVTVTLAAVAAAIPTGGGGGSSQCNTGAVQCCNSVQQADSHGVQSVAGLVGAIVPANVLVGLTCSPISAVALNGNGCSAQAVCCENNSFNGLIALGCTPINVNV